MEGKRSRIVSENAGEQEQMGVEVREVDPFNLWVRANAPFALGSIITCRCHTFSHPSPMRVRYLHAIRVHLVAHMSDGSVAILTVANRLHVYFPDLATTSHTTIKSIKTANPLVQLWFELYRPPSPREAELLEELLASWFMLGRLGAYNAQNLQVKYCPASFCQAANMFFMSATCSTDRQRHEK